jgi:hypothetical protein
VSAGRSIALLLASLLLIGGDAKIISSTPRDGAKDVDPDTAVQIHVPGAVAPASLNTDGVRLVDPDKKIVAAALQTDLGGVITISPHRPLRPMTTYTIEVTAALKLASGEAMTPFSAEFTTGRGKGVEDDPGFRFKRTKVVDVQGATRILLGPDRRLYEGDWEGKLYRYELSGDDSPPKKQQLYSIASGRILGMAFEPGTPAQRPVLWLAYDRNAGQSTTPQNTTGVISRLVLEDKPQETVFITGLLSAAHALNGIAFHPVDRRLFISQGSTTHLGAPSPENWRETPISGAILVADVLAKDADGTSAFNGGRLPINVSPEAPAVYDPAARTAPVRLYASGIREAYGLCFHSNGNLYAGINMNDTTAKTPDLEGGVKGFNVRPDEQLVVIREGKYYGHPNPARGQMVLLGGNPTAQKDPWEIAGYPIGTKPDKDFDPSLLIASLVPVGGQSCNGMIEFKAEGPLRGRLLACFYTSARTVHTFKFSKDGLKVEDSRPLCDEAGKPLKFPSPLDLCMDDESGAIYVADFADPRRSDAAKSGAIWKLTAALAK